MNDVEYFCDRCGVLHDHEAIQSIERLIFLLQLTLIFMILSNIVMVFAIVSLCLGWA